MISKVSIKTITKLFNYHPNTHAFRPVTVNLPHVMLTHFLLSNVNWLPSGLVVAHHCCCACFVCSFFACQSVSFPLAAVTVVVFNLRVTWRLWDFQQNPSNHLLITNSLLPFLLLLLCFFFFCQLPLTAAKMAHLTISFLWSFVQLISYIYRLCSANL